MSETNDGLLERAIGGDAEAFDKLFELHRERLRRSIRVSLHPLVRRRLDESDIVQESYIKAMNGIGNYEARDNRPFFLWLRFIAKQQVLQAHRTHLDAKMRSLHSEAWFDADSALSEVFAARLKTGNTQSPLSEMAQQEMSQKVRQILSHKLSEPDREILHMRHFEMLSNEEIALVFNISRSNASTRYIRALTRLRALIESELGSSIDLD